MDEQKRNNIIIGISVAALLGVVILILLLALILGLAIGLGVKNNVGFCTTNQNGGNLYTFFALPSTFYPYTTNSFTLFISGFVTNPQRVELWKNGQNVQTLNFTVVTLSKLNVLLPLNSTTSGSYNLAVVAQNGCKGVALNSLNITQNISVIISSVTPQYVYNQDSSSITLTGTGFENAPQVFIASGNITIPLRSLVLTSPSIITGIIPPNTYSGTFDVILVNNDATVGVKYQTINLVTNPVPLITSIAPISIPTSNTVVTIFGSFFISGLTLNLDCSIGNGIIYSYPATSISSVNSSTIVATMPGASITANSLCVVTVTNPNGVFYKYSGITVKNPSGNLPPFTAGATTMNQGRKGLSFETAKTTTGSRYVYAIGGRDGSSVLISSVENANVDIYGNIGTWSYIEPLPYPLANADSTMIGSYIYVVGGAESSTGTEIVSTVTLRSQILDPLATPLPDVQIDLDLSQSNFTGGLWFYVISANFPSNYDPNPNGESLPGELVTLNLPSDKSGFIITLTWDLIPGAISYNVYRTPTPNLDISSLRLLNTTMSNIYIERNLNIINMNKAPLPNGAIGKWQIIGPQLNTERRGLAVTLAPSRSVLNLYHLYAFLGMMNNGSYLSTYEILNVTVNPKPSLKASETHSYTQWTVGTQFIGTSRSDVSALTLGNFQFSTITQNTYWIYLGPGEIAPNTQTTVVQAQQIGLNGEFVGSFVQYSLSGTQQSSGYCWFESAGYLLRLGGQGGAPSVSGESAQLCTSGSSCFGLPIPPSFRNWNSLGTTKFTVPRYQMKCVEDGPFIFAAGGETGTNTVTATIDQNLA